MGGKGSGRWRRGTSRYMTGGNPNAKYAHGRNPALATPFEEQFPGTRLHPAKDPWWNQECDCGYEHFVTHRQCRTCSMIAYAEDEAL